MAETNKCAQLTQARAMLTRDYMVINFKMDDTRFKTMALGKTARTPENDRGAVEIPAYAFSR